MSAPTPQSEGGDGSVSRSAPPAPPLPPAMPGPVAVPTQPASRPQLQMAPRATHIDRLNIGAIPTIKLNWLQPHEGSIVDFLFRGRAFQYDKLLGV